MKRVNYLFVFLLVAMSLFGTAQTPDLIIFKGDTLPLYSLPLNSFPTQALINPKEPIWRERLFLYWLLEELYCYMEDS